MVPMSGASCSLEYVKLPGNFPWQKTDSSEAAEEEKTQSSRAEAESTESSAAADHEQHRKGYTPKKGRPTPKRDVVELERGVRRPPVQAPETAKEARERRKALKASMSKEEFKELKRKERQKQSEERRRVQEAMDRGEEKYLMARDRGPARRFIRDWVDSRRFLTNWIMPVALVLLLIMLITQNYPQTGAIVSTLSMVVMLTFFAEGVFVGRRASRAAREKFPNTTERGFSLGLYAYSRATQLRRLRSPKPRVAIGDSV